MSGKLWRKQLKRFLTAVTVELSFRGFCPCCVLPVMDEFAFERIEEALHRSIVIAVALTAHRGAEASGLDHLAVLRA